MKTLREYIAESREWMHTPAEGDSFAFELPDETICETYIIEVADDCILLDSTEEINAALAEWAALEDTDEGDSGVIMETMGYGSLVGEGSMKRQMHSDSERLSLEDFKELYGDEDWIEDFWRVSNDEPKRADDPIASSKDSNWSSERRAAAAKKGDWPEESMAEGNIEDLEKDIAAAPVKPIANMEEDEMSEAEYRGRKVPLGKPMRGDVKKFKVYVKDPKTGNVKKVNFGHGGTSAKRAGQKTMKIKKSNPARRKSFRARHNCANPGPRTKARYWSCRAW
jgi:hypothetical protein